MIRIENMLSVRKLTNVWCIALLLVFVGFSGCHEPEHDVRAELCSYVTAANAHKTIPIINDFLNGLSNNLNEEQQLQEFVTWLNSCSCLKEAQVICQQCISYSGIPVSIVYVSLDENETTKYLCFDISKSYPLKVVEYRVEPDNGEVCAFINEEYIGKMIPVIDKFLSNLPKNMSNSQKLQELATWFKLQPCVYYADVI